MKMQYLSDGWDAKLEILAEREISTQHAVIEVWVYRDLNGNRAIARIAINHRGE